MSEANQNKVIKVNSCESCPKNGRCSAHAKLTSKQRVFINISNSVPSNYMLKDCPLQDDVPLTPKQQCADDMYEMLDQICISMHKIDAGTIEDILAIEALLTRARGEQ